MATLLLGGLHTADLSSEEEADFASQIALFPVDLALGVATDGASPVLASLVGKAADLSIKGPLQEIIQGVIGGHISPGDVSKEADKLAKIQIKALEASLKSHHAPAMSEEDRARLEDEFRGSMEKVIQAALGERDG